MHWGCVGVYNGYRLVRADFVVFHYLVKIQLPVIRLQHHHNRATIPISLNFVFVQLIFFIFYIWIALEK